MHVLQKQNKLHNSRIVFDTIQSFNIMEQECRDHIANNDIVLQLLCIPKK